MASNNFSYWFNLVKTNVSSVSLPHDEFERLALEIAGICMQSEDDGETVGVWHACAMVMNRVNRCNCYRCEVARKEKRL